MNRFVPDEGELEKIKAALLPYEDQFFKDIDQKFVKKIWSKFGVDAYTAAAIALICRNGDPDDGRSPMQMAGDIIESNYIAAAPKSGFPHELCAYAYLWGLVKILIRNDKDLNFGTKHLRWNDEDSTERYIRIAKKWDYYL